MSKGGSRDIELTETLIKKKNLDEPGSFSKAKVDAEWLKYITQHLGRSLSQTILKTASATVSSKRLTDIPAWNKS
jgi:hypothetical protein